MDRAMQERLVGATILVLIAVLLIPWLLDGSTQPVGKHTSERELILPGTAGSGSETRVISLDAANSGGSVNPPPAVDTRAVRDEVADSSNSERVSPKRPGSFAKDEVPAVAEVTPKPSEHSPPPAVASAAADSSETMPPATASTTAPGTESESTPTAPAATVKSNEQTVAANTTVSRDAPTSADQTPTDNSPPATFSTPMPTRPAATENALGWAVQVGSFARQENAERLAEQLRDKKYKAFVMRHVVDGRVRFRVRVGPVKQRAEADLLAAALTEDRQPVKVLRHP